MTDTPCKHNRIGFCRSCYSGAWKAAHPEAAKRHAAAAYRRAGKRPSRPRATVGADKATWRTRLALMALSGQIRALGKAIDALTAALPRSRAKDGPRKQAKRAGLPTYVGESCAYGHGNVRQTRNRRCVECLKADSQKRDNATDGCRRQSKQWRTANPDKVRVWRKRGTARLRAVKGETCDGPINAASLAALLAAQRGGCAYCGSPDNLQLDHKHPVSRGGEHVLSNAQLLCAFHNGSKNDQTDAEYRDRHLIADVTPWDSL